jgi:hypothetical protein
MRTKTSYQRQIVLKDSEFVVQEIAIVREFDEILRQWISTKKEPTYKPLSTWTPKLEKELTLEVLEYRAVNSVYGLQEAFFLREVKVKVPKLKRFKNLYLTKVGNNIVTNNLASGFSSLLSYRGLFDSDNDLTVSVGSPKRISKEKAQKLIAEGIKVLQKIGSEFVVRV